MVAHTQNGRGGSTKVTRSAETETPSVPGPDHIVYVVDDDLRVQVALTDLLSACQYNVRAFGSAAAFIESPQPPLAGCLILDIELPDINGLDLQRQLACGHPPIVFITGHGDVSSSVRAMKAGAVDFLSKPFSEQQLLAAVDAAIARDRKDRALNAELTQLRARYGTLTPREREVLPLVVSGLLNKQAARVLGISVVTMQVHRGNIMRKMAARAYCDLVRLSEKLQIPRYDVTMLERTRSSGPGTH